jgi:signal transduction histidine kinase/CheY-like chemotaxis protein
VILQNLSIRRKLTLITMLTSSVALILSSASLLVYDLVSYRHLLSQDLVTQTKVIGYNSAAAMVFKDVSAATTTLSALKAKKDIVTAILYGRDGKVFAYYSRDGKSVPASLSTSASLKDYKTEPGYLSASREVTLNGEFLGNLYLQSDMRQWNVRARQYATIVLGLVLISSLFALLVSSKLQGLISRPILHLEDTMKMVSSNKNYEIRAVKSSDDEIGRLIDGFNTMLSEIQQRDAAVRGANTELKTRTQELEEEVRHRKRTQEELLNAKHAAEEASRAKSTFLANMSHELRTPLNAIIGYSEMLEEEVQDSGKLDNVQDLHKIQTAGKHLLALINDVLDLSKIEAGKMGLHLETFDPSMVVDEIVTTLRPAIEKNSNRILVRVAENVGPMRADLTKVRQVLFNLLSNACKFTEHGTISLEVDQEKEGIQDWIRFRVTDTGIGISTQQKQNLFQEFSQADASISRKYGGTGLGLAISHRFVKLMKGRIEVESEPAKGSTFTLRMPTHVVMETMEYAPPSAGDEAPLAIKEAEKHLNTILVIDDDPSVRDLMSRFLGKLGFHVAAAADGEEGLLLAKKVRPLLITLDVVMPECDGWTVLRRLKSDPELAEVPVIMVTVVDNQAMGLDLGASSYLVKPVNRERLADVIEKYKNVQSSTITEAYSVPLINKHDGRARCKTHETQARRRG